ncbi:MAG: hypothetical protein ABWK53_00580 [Anaerolineales bacterium]
MSILDSAPKDEDEKRTPAERPADGEPAARRPRPAQPRPRPTFIPPRLQPGTERSAAPPPPAAEQPRPAQPVSPPPPAAAATPERQRGRGINPGLRLRAIESAGRESKQARLSLWKRILRRPEGRLTMHAYWTVTGTISLIVNAILIAAVLILSRYVYVLSARLSNDLLYNGLYESFGAMDAASIRTQIPVNTIVHASLPVTINQTTEVVLTRDTTITRAYVTLSTGGLEIVRAPTNIILPAGTVLPVQLNLTVPVEADIPVSLVVPVNIPLNQTELHGPFVTLRRAVEPYALAFHDPTRTPTDWQHPWLDAPACQSFQGLCDLWFVEVGFPQP